MALEFSAALQRIPVYPAAKGYAAPEPLVRLASNESPYPPIPAVVDAIAEALPRLNRYPDPHSGKLKQALSDRYGVPPARISVGNGSCDVLLAAGAALLEPGAELVYAWPSFSEYPHLAAASGAREIRVPLDAEERHDLAAMLQEITVATRLVIVCNPNNPTSTALPLSDLEAFIAEVPRHVCIVLDEAYCEFNLLNDPDESLELLNRYPNLVLLRTFSKVYGLCGLRIGFALCGSDELPRALDLIRQPFHTNAAAQAAAVEALKHQDVVADRVTRTIAERLAVEEALQAMGLHVAQSQTNFCWVHLGDDRDEQAILDGLAERGVLVRSGTALGREGALRVTYGTDAENQRFLETLRELL
jgi:histidinol-phosphate aminotransferase